jgi:hypothetical protein
VFSITIPNKYEAREYADGTTSVKFNSQVMSTQVLQSGVVNYILYSNIIELCDMIYVVQLLPFS